MTKISEIKKSINKAFLIAIGPALCFLTKMPSMAEPANNITTFSGNVAGSCSFNGLADDVSMAFAPTGGVNGSKLLVGSDYFSLTSNGSAKISVSFAVTQEPEGFIPGVQRGVLIREEVNNNYKFTSNSSR